jgi:hypothetical protein
MSAVCTNAPATQKLLENRRFRNALTTNLIPEENQNNTTSSRWRENYSF